MSFNRKRNRVCPSPEESGETFGGLCQLGESEFWHAGDIYRSRSKRQSCAVSQTTLVLAANPKPVQHPHEHCEPLVLPTKVILGANGQPHHLVEITELSQLRDVGDREIITEESDDGKVEGVSTIPVFNDKSLCVVGKAMKVQPTETTHAVNTDSILEKLRSENSVYAAQSGYGQNALPEKLCDDSLITLGQRGLAKKAFEAKASGSWCVTDNNGGLGVLPPLTRGRVQLVKLDYAQEKLKMNLEMQTMKQRTDRNQRGRKRLKKCASEQSQNW